MKIKTILRYSIATLVLLAMVWTALTVYVEQKGPAKQWTFGTDHGKVALIVFDPDPFYNLDEQVCLAFGKVMSTHGVKVTVATVAAAEEFNDKARYDVVVYCANTYNWRPDWAITNYIEEYPAMNPEAAVVAITLGAGSTELSQRKLEETITNSSGTLMWSYSLWLWRPNDESKTDESNVDVAVIMARDWASQIANRLN
jgi:hypothetical protein